MRVFLSFFMSVLILFFGGCAKESVVESKQEIKEVKKVETPKREEFFVGVMISREYDAKTNMYKYVVKSPEDGKTIEFGSIDKILYKDDLVRLRLLDGVVDVKGIALLMRQYYKQPKNRQTGVLLQKEEPKNQKSDTVKKPLQDSVHPNGYPKSTDAEAL